MDKQEAKKLGSWISLLGGCCFVIGALLGAYLAFGMKAETAWPWRVLLWLGHRFH